MIQATFEVLDKVQDDLDHHEKKKPHFSFSKSRSSRKRKQSQKTWKLISFFFVGTLFKIYTIDHTDVKKTINFLRSVAKGMSERQNVIFKLEPAILVS